MSFDVWDEKRWRSGGGSGVRACVAALLLGLLCVPAWAGGKATADAHVSDTRGGAKRPNILLIVADDLGYSDIGAFGGEIQTPNLDQLAAQGRRLTNFHTSPTCSPTRAALISGTDHHLAGLGTMEGMNTPSQKDKPGFEGYLNDRVLSFPALLREAGYHTYISGKWHLGSDPAHIPSARGFERSFGVLGGGANHYAEPVLFNAKYLEDGKPVALPKDFYSTDYYTDKLISFIDQGRKDGKPFFAFAAYTSPHWPLQAPREYIDKYRGKYDAGYDAIRERRLERQRQLGLISPSVVPHPGYAETADLPKWEGLTPEQRKFEARRMEIYAAMVDNLDHNIGRLIEHLKKTGQYDNTLIVFHADNGAQGTTVKGFFPKSYDNSFDNLGNATSYVAYGHRWAEVGSTPYRLYKGYTAEGGVNVVGILRHPSFTRSNHRNIDAFITVQDWAPTFLELAGAKNPGTKHRGQEVYPLRGTSILPYLAGKVDSPHPKAYVFGEELFGQRSIIKDEWKIVWLTPPAGPGRWQLYNLKRDPTEIRDLAKEEPAKLAELIGEWDKYVASSNVILPDARNAYLEEPLGLPQ